MTVRRSVSFAGQPLTTPITHVIYREPGIRLRIVREHRESSTLLGSLFRVHAASTNVNRQERS